MNSFSDFYAHADPLLHIHNKQDYKTALEMTEFLLEKASDAEDDPANDLIILDDWGLATMATQQRHDLLEILESKLTVL